jgi:aspartate aminotransferase
MLSRNSLCKTIFNLAPSATLAINEETVLRRQRGERVYKFGFGQSPFPVLGAAVDNLAKFASEKDYLPVRGLLPLRETIASYYSRRLGVCYDAEQTLIGPGSKELFFLTQLCLNAKLVLPAPSWVSYEPQAQLAGRSVQWIHTERQHNWQLTARTLDDALSNSNHDENHNGNRNGNCHDENDHGERCRLLVLNSPSNPTGLTIDSDGMEALAEVLRAHPDVVVLSDEIYSELQYDDDAAARPVSMAGYLPERTIVSGGLSKWAGAGGWRLGAYCVPPQLDWLADAIAVAASETFTSVSAPIQHASVCAWQPSEATERYLSQSRRVLRTVGNHVASSLRVSSVLVDDPQGGFYVMPDFELLRERLASAKSVHTSAELAERLMRDTGVATLPGSSFGMPPSSLTLRLAFVDFDGAHALSQASCGDVNTLAPNVVEGTRVMCEWLDSLSS